VIGGVASNADASSSKPIPLATAGGQVCVGFVDECDPATNTWKQRSMMPTPRNHFLAALADGKIYALNGRTGSAFVNMAAITDLVEMYDPAEDAWTLVGRAPTDRGDVNGATYKNHIYIAGGEYETTKVKEAFWAFQAYDAVTNTWETLPHVAITRHGFAAAFIGNVLHVVGGSFQSDGLPGVYSPTATHETYTVLG
jgi:N-acetylneuraminic acid mutarotase